MEHETVGGAVVAGVQPFRQGSDVDALVVKLLNGLQSLSEVPRQAVNPRACGKRDRLYLDHVGKDHLLWSAGLAAWPVVPGRRFRRVLLRRQLTLHAGTQVSLISLGLGPFFGGRLFHCRQSTRGLACASGSASRRCKLR